MALITDNAAPSCSVRSRLPFLRLRHPPVYSFFMPRIFPHVRLCAPFLVAGVLLFPLPARAQEFFGLVGLLQEVGSGNRTGSWQLEYREALTEHVGYSLSYLNEGHLPGHHRDGHTVQLWSRLSLLDRRLTLSLGAGPFHYFDTIAARNAASYNNEHGWGAEFTAAAVWPFADRWMLQVRSNLIRTFSGHDSFSTLAGIGYQLETPERRVAKERQPMEQRNEVAAYAGRAIVNGPDSENSVATAVEYRRRFSPSIDASLAWIYEGDKRLTRRNGISIQLWGDRDFFIDRLSIAAGFGAYFSVDHYRNNDGRQERAQAISGILTLATSYRIHPRYTLRVAWNRMITGYSRDTDVILGGIGYRF